MNLRAIPVLAAIAAFAALSMGASSCSTTTKDTADAGSSSGSKKAVIGDPITLKGTDATVKVTPLRIRDPLSVGSYDEPDNGKRFVGVDVELKNSGKTTYNDSPSNGAVLITADHQQADATLVTGGPCSGDFSSSAIIAPGETREGCIPFEVPAHAKVAEFQFTLDSGFGPQAGEWTVAL